jgi:hypothetical protein
MRWEFYVQIMLLQLAQAFANGAFRVLLSEMIPVGSEIRWFSIQLVLSCGTVWVNYVASAPLQNSTHQLRFPLILSLVFLVVALTLEVSRVTLGVFARDAEKWRVLDKTGSVVDMSAEACSPASVRNEKGNDLDVRQLGSRVSDV